MESQFVGRAGWKKNMEFLRLWTLRKCFRHSLLIRINYGSASEWKLLKNRKEGRKWQYLSTTTTYSNTSNEV